jgi:hypothetical protein
VISLALLAQLVTTDRVILADRVVRLSDVVAGSRSARPVLAVPRSLRELTFDRRALASLAARAAEEPVMSMGPGSIRLTLSVTARRPVAYRPMSPAIAKGSTLTVATGEGAVRILKSVTAMEAGRPGRPLFVRDAEGAIFSARVPEQAR